MSCLSTPNRKNERICTHTTYAKDIECPSSRPTTAFVYCTCTWTRNNCKCIVNKSRDHERTQLHSTRYGGVTLGRLRHVKESCWRDLCGRWREEVEIKEEQALERYGVSSIGGQPEFCYITVYIAHVHEYRTKS